MKDSVKNLASYVPPTPEDQLKQKYGLSRIVRLSANENPYGTSKKVATAVSKAVPLAENFYPDANATELRAAVVKQLAVNGQNIIFGCGLDEIITMVSRIFLTPGDEVLVAGPTFSEYQLNAEIEGAVVKTVPVDGKTGQNDLNGFLKQLTSRTKLIWICNPNNPTGGYNEVDAISQFMKQVPNDVLVVVDEAYIDYVTDQRPASAVGLLKQFDNLALMRTLSKAYGLASFRVGYIIMDTVRAKYMQAVRLPYNLNQLSQVAAVAAIQDQAFINDVVAKNATERNRWAQFLDQHDLKYYPSAANFIYFQVPNAELITDQLIQSGYQVRLHQEPNWLRVTIGTPKDNQAIQTIIERCLNDN
ncbi:histidinol-phosphate transaminase (plasmid) [Nicoliella spurrieriana]|uniref:Histidinol-phosphate aminotransferase n=1 Tax=Nicoliella spurrieriana TaxID=2925830 RepID=A0A976X4G9_9LACO|nr:histidinol-phosphate transaminase [Nicoliella spurrieriana]UQS85933.1 histidinol-phosphate transaminase [Nicoliella spurrieriana]